MIDTHVYLSRWPARRLPGDQTPQLVEKLRAKDVTQAWAGSFDALLHRDIAGVNLRLARECQQHGDGLLVPIGAVNPALPDWQDDVRRCQEEHGMPGIRLHPNYHGYKLSDAVFGKLLELAAERQMLVQIALRMEDPRTQHPLLVVPDVDAAPLAALVAKLPNLRVQLLNAPIVLRPDVLDKLIAAGNVSIEIATVEGVEGITRLLAHCPLERVLFGSYFPFFAWESAELKLKESPLAEAQRMAITRDNAATLVKR